MPAISTNLGDSSVPISTVPADNSVRQMNRGGAPDTDYSGVHQRIDAVLRIGLSNRPRGDFSPDSPLGRAQKFADAALALLKNFATAVRDVNADIGYSPIGRQRKIIETGQTFLLRLETLVSTPTWLPFLKDVLARATSRVADSIKLPNADDMASLMLQREIRDRMTAMDESQRLQVWRSIMDSRDPHGIAAVLNAPKYLPLLNPRVVEEGVKQVSDAANPEAAKLRAEADSAVQAVEAMRDDVKAMIAGASGIDLRPARVGLAAADAGGAA